VERKREGKEEKRKNEGKNRKNKLKLVKKTNQEISPAAHTYILLWGREFRKKL